MFAADLDVKTIRVDTVLAPNYFETDPEGKKIGAKAGLERIASVWDKASKIAADYGLNICWEFEPGFAFNKPSEITQLVDAVRAKGNANFGVLYDTLPRVHVRGDWREPNRREGNAPRRRTGVARQVEGAKSHTFTSSTVTAV